MIDKLPECWKPMVDAANAGSPTNSYTVEHIILVFLNAALEAGVAYHEKAVHGITHGQIIFSLENPK